MSFTHPEIDRSTETLRAVVHVPPYLYILGRAIRRYSADVPYQYV